ncbi:thioesterase [Carbonactinospora thermoautotrophica]|nr:thioesterase [Carbonactinospora thermoautotrophica]
MSTSNDRGGAVSRSTTSVLPPEAVVPEPHPDAPPPGAKLGSHYSRCFGCGRDHPTGLHMELTVGEGLSVDARFTVTENHQGAPGLAHGGLLAAAFDEALGSITWLLRRPAVTARLETDFLRPVPVDSTLYLHAKCDGVAGRKIYLSAEGRLDALDGPVAVRAHAIFVTVTLEHFTTHGRPEDVAAARESGDVQAAVRAFEVNP